jgi:hypothetical protein
MSDSPFAIFVSCVEGRLVSRFGTSCYVGADFDKDNNLRFDVDMVVAIPHAEMAVYRREYEKHLRCGDLLARTVEDFESYQTKLLANDPATKPKADVPTADTLTPTQAPTEAPTPTEPTAAPSAPQQPEHKPSKRRSE